MAFENTQDGVALGDGSSLLDSKTGGLVDDEQRVVVEDDFNSSNRSKSKRGRC